MLEIIKQFVVSVIVSMLMKTVEKKIFVKGRKKDIERNYISGCYILTNSAIFIITTTLI